MLNLTNNETKTIAGAAMLVGVFSLVSRVVGFVRDRILAGTFGAGDVLDVYYAAFKLPDLLFHLLVIGALSASFIPLFIKHYHRVAGRQQAWQLTNNVLNLIGIGMAVLSVALFLLADPLAELIAPGFFAPKQQQVADFTRVMILAEFLLALSVVFGSVLQGLKRFLLYALAPIFYNIGIIIGALWLTDMLGPIGLAWGVVLGAFFHLLVQLYGVMQSGYRYQWMLDWQSRDAREILMLMGPRVIALALSQLNTLIMTVIASGLAIGSVAMFNFAFNIQFLPIGIIGVSYAIAAFPMLSEHAEKKDDERFIGALSASARQVLFFIVPFTVLFLVLRMQIVRVVVGAGAFGWAETIVTADTIAFFTLSFFAQCLIFLFTRAFFALRDTTTPLVAGVVGAVVTLLGSLYFSREVGVAGLAFAFSIGAIVNLVLLWVPLHTRLGTLHEWRIVQSLYVFTGAGLFAGFVMQLMKSVVVRFVSLDTFVGVLLQGLIAGGAGLIAYGLIAWLLKNPEMRDFVSSIRRRLFRQYQPEETVVVE